MLPSWEDTAAASNLLEVIHRLRDHGNTIVVIEHNLASSRPPTGLLTWDPRGGSGGGQIIATETPEQLAGNKHSFTGNFLKRLLG